MDRFDVDDVSLTYELRDGAERVLLVHANAFVSWYRPLLEQLPGIATLSYRRRLLPSDGDRYRPLTVAEDAAVCARLMDHVGWPTAHVVGHSYGALVALQLAIDAPSRVRSVALLEPAARGISSSEQIVAALQPVFAAYTAGDKSGAVDTFLNHVCGDGYRAVLDSVVPGAFDEAVERGRPVLPSGDGGRATVELRARRRQADHPTGAQRPWREQRPALRARKRTGAVVVPPRRAPDGPRRRTPPDGRRIRPPSPTG